MVIEEMQSKSNNGKLFMMAQDTGSAIRGLTGAIYFSAPDSMQVEKLGLQNSGVR